MKNIYFLALLALPISNGFAQNVFDAVRYSTTQTYGSARFSALSGAFSALGGEMTSIGLNPAGSSVFLQNQVSFTFATIDKNNSSNYFGTTALSGDTDFNIANSGVVFVFNNWNDESPWKKFTMGINFNLTNNFQNETYVLGNTSKSLGNFFADSAQGYPLSLFQLQGGESISSLYTYLGETEGTAAQNAFLAYQGYIIDPLEDIPNNTSYYANTGSGRFTQDYIEYTDGYMGQYTLNFSTQYTNNLYFGLNLNTHSIDYLESSYIVERNTNNNSSIKRIGFENNLSVRGSGFSFQVGAIAKVNESLRLSLVVDSPTWYTISEETIQSLESSRLEEGITLTTVIDPRIINVFRDYNFQTPAKYTMGTAYVFGTKGLLSIEYSYKDYNSAKFKPTYDSYFQEENQNIKNALKGSSAIKLGSEYRWNEFSFRGGLNFEESPFSDKDILGDKYGFSLGLGYNIGAYSLDFSYARMQQDQSKTLFVNGNRSQIDATENMYLLSININL
jgi:hypothetical protein